MFLFTKPKQDQDLERLKSNVARAFSKVKEDTKILYQWIEYLSAQNIQLKQTIEDLRSEVSIMPSSPEEVRRIIDKYYSFDTLFSRLDHIERKIKLVESNDAQKRQVSERLPSQTLQENRQKLQETIAKRITKNSKDYIKNMLISLISKYENISSAQLKEMVVEEQKLCSKSSFYRLIEELEEDHSLSVFSAGKYKSFAANISLK